MESVGLLQKVLSLLEACSKPLDIYDAYRDPTSDINIPALRLQVQNQKILKWANRTALLKGAMDKRHSSILDNMQSIKTIIRICSEISASLKDIDGCLSKMMTNELTSEISQPRWTNEDKQQVDHHLDMVEDLVQSLYTRFLVNAVNETGNGVMPRLTELSIPNGKQQDHVNVRAWLSENNFVQHHTEFDWKHIQGTCGWITQHDEYNSWATARKQSPINMRLLWIRGAAGCGKTFLTSWILRGFGVPADSILAYCFSDVHLAAGGSFADIPKLWIAQLLHCKPDVLGPALRAAKYSVHRLAAQSETWDLLRVICKRLAPCMLAVDGLNEYSPWTNDRSDFIRRIWTYLGGLEVKVLISSRDETDIVQAFKDNEVSQRQVKLYRCNLVKDMIQPDMRKYVINVVSERLSNKAYSAQSNFVEVMLEMSDDIFSWVNLKQTCLDSSKSQNEILEVLHSSPKGVTIFHEQCWECIQLSIDCDQDIAITLLMWITFSVRPLTITELVEAVCISATIMYNDEREIFSYPDSLSKEISEEYIKNEIEVLCRSLIELRRVEPDNITSSTIHFLNNSARDFVVRKLSQEINQGGNLDLAGYWNHSLLARCCVQYLRFGCGWNLEQRRWGVGLDSVLRDYASEFWHRHVLAAGETDSTIIEFTADFMDPSCAGFQVWIQHIHAKSINPKSHASWPPGNPLYYACLFALHAVAELIAARHPEYLNDVGGEFGTPLELACVRNDVGLVRKLLQWGASSSVIGGIYGTPMNAAASLGHMQCIAILIEHHRSLIIPKQELNINSTLTKEAFKPVVHLSNPINMSAPTFFECEGHFVDRGFRDRTPLHCAFLHQQLDVVIKLLQEGADIKAQDDLSTALVLASARGNLEMFKFLLDAGGDITASANIDNDLLTSLNAAARFGYIQIAEELLNRGADIHNPDKVGWRPLDYAASRHQVQVVTLLLSRGAPLNTRSNGTDSALRLCCIHSPTDRTEVAEVLIAHGARGYGVSNDADTCIHVACRGGKLGLVKLLLAIGTPVNLPRSDNGWQPIHEAAAAGHLEILELLLSNNASLNAKTTDDSTPLLFATAAGYIKIVSYLIQAGAEINAADSFGRAAIHFAYNLGEIEILRLLVRHRANPDHRTGNGWCVPLSYGVELKMAEAFQTTMSSILEHGIDESADIKNPTPLMANWFLRHITGSSASIHRHEISRWLIEAGVGFQNYHDYIDAPLRNKGDRLPSLRDIQCLIRGLDLEAHNSRSQRLIDAIAIPAGQAALDSLECIFTSMQGRSLHDSSSIEAELSTRPCYTLPGIWSAVYTYTEQSDPEVTTFSVNPISSHEFKLFPTNSEFFAVTGTDLHGEFKLLGSLKAGDENVWFNKLYRTHGWLCVGTLSILPLACDGQTATFSEENSHLTKVVIEGKWGTGWKAWRGTFKLERTLTGKTYPQIELAQEQVVTEDNSNSRAAPDKPDIEDG